MLKAIEEAESEWSTHAAKALIEMGTKGLRGSVPPNFPYFYVQFGYAKGYVHVIDDVGTFDPAFGRKVLVGLLQRPAEDMHRRGRSDSGAAQGHLVAGFAKEWEPYDWTKQLE